MQLKKLSTIFDLFVGVCVIASIVLAWKAAKAYEAPHFEIIENAPATATHEYATYEGELKEGEYLLAWDNREFFKNHLIWYDAEAQMSAPLSEEQFEKYGNVVEKSHYGMLRRTFWPPFIIFSIIFAIIGFCISRTLADFIISRFVASQGNFRECAAFLYSDPWAGKKEVEKVFQSKLNAYVNSKCAGLIRRYGLDYAQPFIALLKELVSSRQSKLKYYLYWHTDRLNPDFRGELLNLRNQWQKSSSPNRDHILSLIDNALSTSANKLVRPYDLSKLNADSLASAMTYELKEAIANVLGDQVVNLEGDTTVPEFALPSISNRLVVHIDAYNSHNYCTFGNEPGIFPSVELGIEVIKYIDGKKHVMWNVVLAPSFSYTCKEDDFKPKDLYEEMVKSTLRTFAKNLRK